MIKKKDKKKIIFSLILSLFLIFNIGITYSYLMARNNFTMYSNVLYTLSYEPIVNKSNSMSQTLNLGSTITNGMPLAPGAEGKFDIEIDFSKTDYDEYYKIDIGATNLPNNLSLYSDSNYTINFQPITGSCMKNDSNQKVIYTIYWKWEYKNTSQDNFNDSLFQESSINIPVIVYFNQREGEY